MKEEDIQQYKSDLNILVNIRNSIAHGENSVMVDFGKMVNNIQMITNLIDAMLLKQVHYIKTEAYLASSLLM